MKKDDRTKPIRQWLTENNARPILPPAKDIRWYVVNGRVLAVLFFADGGWDVMSPTCFSLSTQETLKKLNEIYPRGQS